MTKRDLQNFVSKLPEGDYSLEDLQYRLSLYAALQHSLEQADRGEVITLEELEQDLDRWLSE